MAYPAAFLMITFLSDIEHVKFTNLVLGGEDVECSLRDGSWDTFQKGQIPFGPGSITT